MLARDAHNQMHAKTHEKPPATFALTLPHPHFPTLHVQQAARAWQRPVSSTTPCMSGERAVSAGATARTWLEVRTELSSAKKESLCGTFTR